MHFTAGFPYYKFVNNNSYLTDMKKIILRYCIAALALSAQPVFCQTEEDAPLLGLPGDNLDLYAVLDLFQKSKTIEDFEKSLNEKKSEVNNLDLDLDKKVDFIKVVTKKEESSFTFILQVAVSKTETQDVAVILVDKDKNGKVSLQIVGDEDLYGKDYVIEPKTAGSPAVTANPAYVGPEPVTKSVPATTTVVVETVPIVQYVYSPAYVPYYPPYYYGYYPPYFAAFTVMAVGIYRHHHYHHHGGYYGGHYGGGNTVIINNKNIYNNYNNNKMRSTTVTNNRASGRYNNGNSATNRVSSRPSAGTSNRASNGAAASTRNTNRASGGSSAGVSNRSSSRASSATRTPSQGTSIGSGRTRNGGGLGSGGARTGGARAGGALGRRR